MAFPDELNSINCRKLQNLDLNHILNTIGTSPSCSSELKTVLSALKASFYNRICLDRDGKDIAFLFSSCYQTRKDHLARFNKVVSLFPASEVFVPNKSINIANIRYIPSFFSILRSVKKVIHSRKGAYISLCLYITYIESCYIVKMLRKSRAKKLVVFCDMHPVDNMVVQMCKKYGIRTYTLQHGHYTVNSPAFIHSVSDYFIGFGQYSRHVAEESGYNIQRYYSAGMMDIINRPICNQMVVTSHRMSLVILSGCIKEDISLLRLSEFIVLQGYTRFIKFHPGSNSSSYDYKWEKTDRLITDQITIQDLFDQCDFQIVAGGSTVYAEGVIGLFPSFLFDYDKIRYEGLSCLRFSNACELKAHLKTLLDDPATIEKSLLQTREFITETQNVEKKYIDAILNDRGII